MASNKQTSRTGLSLFILVAWIFINLVSEWTHELPAQFEPLTIGVDQHAEHAVFPLHDYLCAACLLAAKHASLPSNQGADYFVQEDYLALAPTCVHIIAPKIAHRFLRAPPRTA